MDFRRAKPPVFALIPLNMRSRSVALFASSRRRCWSPACHPRRAPLGSTQPDSVAGATSPTRERLAGRLTGTPGNDSAAAYIGRRYAALGLTAAAPMYFQRFTARPAAHAGQGVSLPTQNVFAVLAGRDPSLRGEYVVIGAHFDHLGMSTEGALIRTRTRFGLARTTTPRAPPRSSSWPASSRTRRRAARSSSPTSPARNKGSSARRISWTTARCRSTAFIQCSTSTWSAASGTRG